jgi:hypothetical protein
MCCYQIVVYPSARISHEASAWLTTADPSAAPLQPASKLADGLLPARHNTIHYHPVNFCNHSQRALQLRQLAPPLPLGTVVLLHCTGQQSVVLPLLLQHSLQHSQPVDPLKRCLLQRLLL